MNVRDVLLRPMVKRVLLTLTALFVLIGLLGFLAVPHFVRPYLEQALSEKLHRLVKVAELAVNPYAMSVTLKGLSIGQKDGAGELAGLDELYANLEASSLIHLAPVLNELRILGPRFHLVRLTDKRYNISDLIEEFLAKPDEPAAKYALYNIRISGGRIVFEDRPENRRHEVSDLNLGIPLVSDLPSQVEVFVQPALSGKLNGAAFALAGKARPFSATREAALEFGINDLDMRPWLDYVPAKLQFKLGSGRLDGKLQLVLNQPPGKPASLTLSGNVDLRQLALEDLTGKPFLQWSLLKVSLKSLDSTGKAVLDSVALEGPEVRVVRSKDGSLSLSRLVAPGPAASSPSPAQGTGAATAAPDIELRQVLVSGGKLDLSDESAVAPVKLSVAGMDAKLEGLHLAGGALKGSSQLALGMKSLALQGRGEKTAVFSLGQTSATARLDGDKRDLTVTELRSVAGRLMLARAADGALNLQQMLPKEAGPTSPSGKASAKPSQRAPRKAEDGPWTLTLAKLSLEDWAVRFEDAGAPSPLLVESVRLRAENLSTVGGSKAKLDLNAGLGKKGSLGVKGSLSLSPLAGAFDVDMKGLDLVPLQGYVLGTYNLSLARGALEGKGNLHFEQAPTAPFKAGFKGSLGLVDLGLVDKGNASDLLKWKRLSFSGVNASVGGKPALDVSLTEIALKDFFARLVVNPDGTLALRTLLKQEEATTAGHVPETGPQQDPDAKAPAAVPVARGGQVDQAKPAAQAGSSAGPDFRARIGQVVLSGGQVRFSDLFIKPNYSANLTGLSGTVKGLSSDEASTAEVALSGTVDGTAPLTISGKLNPLARNLMLDITADARGIEMSGFSPYAARYAGYGIEKGKLSANIHYTIENRQLKAENHLFLDQLTFGEKVDSPQATKLPVLLAVALLKNSRGEIDINLPISGSLDDPQFSVGGIVVKMFVNLIVKAVTAPFALLGRLFGGGEELAWLEFDPGRSAIAPPNVDKMQKLAKALQDRPALKLEISGRADAATDTEGFKRLQLERKVKAQKLKESVKKGEESESVDDVVVTKEEWPKYLTLAYKAEDFKKPKNMLFMAKSLPPEEMEKLMLDNTIITDEQLRRLAERRSKAVADWLVHVGKVPNDRVFVVAPKLGAESGKDGQQAIKARLCRVDFLLK